MSEAKHTPGPWKCDERPYFGSWFVRQDPVNWDGMGYQLICDCPADKRGTHYGEMFKANARLIAEAPALLAVAEGVMAWWGEHMYDTYSADPDGLDECNVYDGEPEFVTAARTAIAKATGATA